jgi:UDP-glucose:(glucosyl)LPS alpha-1,2-glucosyltransferase
MPVEFNEIALKSNGGTEQLQRRLDVALQALPDLNEKVQIIASRVRTLDDSKYRILWLHDLPGDPESHHLRNEGWRRFHKLVFVSHWQRQAYIQEYNIPWSHTVVMANAINPIDCGDKLADENFLKPREKIRLIYHTTPHRGLRILVPVVKKLAETYPIHLDVFSSFSIYGWPERDAEFEDLFEEIRDNPSIMTHHGAVPNDEVREALIKADIFSYPCVWPETSCLSLMEAMSAGCVCVHPDFGGLPETASNMTMMYSWHENMSSHAGAHYGMLIPIIESLMRGGDSVLRIRTANAKHFADLFYNWESRDGQWAALLRFITEQPLEIPKPEKMFSYSA